MSNIKLLYSYLNLFDKHTPNKIIKFINKRPLSITANVELIIRPWNKAFSKFRITRNDVHWNYYKDICNLTNRTVKLENKHTCNLTLELEWTHNFYTYEELEWLGARFIKRAILLFCAVLLHRTNARYYKN